MKCFFILTIALASSLTQAQFKINNITFPLTEQDGQGSYPIIESSALPGVARKINAYLQENELGFTGEINSAKLTNGLAPSRSASYSYEITTQSEKIFALRFNRTICGMRCMPSNTNYSFDAHTGDLIVEGNLFTPSGKSLVQKSLLVEWKARIKKSLEGPDFADDFKDCLDRANEMEELEFSGIRFLADGIEFEGTSCLDVTDWQLEKDTKEPFVRSFDQFWFALSPYGLQYFVSKPQAGSIMNTILHGMIDNKIPLTMILFYANPGESHEVIRGLEIYDKYRQNIRLSGTLEKNMITVNELDKNGTAVATLEGTWDGKEWKGSFTNIKSGKILSLVMSR